MVGRRSLSGAAGYGIYQVLGVPWYSTIQYCTKKRSKVQKLPRRRSNRLPVRHGVLRNPRVPTVCLVLYILCLDNEGGAYSVKAYRGISGQNSVASAIQKVCSLGRRWRKVVSWYMTLKIKLQPRETAVRT